MIPESVHTLLRLGTDQASHDFLRDSNFFWVAWQEDDDQIPGLCAAVLATKELSAVWEGEDLFVLWRGKRTAVPLARSFLDTLAQSWLLTAIDAVLPVSVVSLLSWPSRGNRHTTILALNEALRPDFEIRYAKPSAVEGTPAFLVLAVSDWRALEEEYDWETIEAVFPPIHPSPNLYTDENVTRSSSEEWWKFW